jgi:hypothetical protein
MPCEIHNEEYSRCISNTLTKSEMNFKKRIFSDQITI